MNKPVTTLDPTAEPALQDATAVVQPSERDVSAVLVRTLPERGLDRMTRHRIESVLCTSALTAHI